MVKLVFLALHGVHKLKYLLNSTPNARFLDLKTLEFDALGHIEGSNF